MIGSVLGKYRIEAELSRGGMGAVYVAQHEVLQRKAAIKVLRPELTASEDMIERFVNEAKAASAIRHPSIIEVFDFGYTDEGQAYLVMEFLQGETLAQRLLARGKLPEADAVRIIRSIAGALSAAHAKGIIHRDLKPDNVFIVPDPDLGERAKILDFGIAKLTEAKGNTMTGALMGTPLYMAPEQARSAAGIDHRADLYSLGCIFYELLTGRPPLVGEGAGEIIALHMFTEPDKPSSIVSGISPPIESIVMQLLEKEPAARLPSAAEVSNALATAYGTASVRPATPPLASMKMPVVGAAPSLAKPPKQPTHLGIVAGGIALALVGVAAVVIALSMRGDDKRPAAVVEPARPIETAPPPAPTPAPAPAPAPAPTPTPAPVATEQAEPARTRPRPQPSVPAHTRKASPYEVTP